MLRFAKDSRVSEFVRKHVFPVKYHDYEFDLSADLDDDPHGRALQYDRIISLRGRSFYMDIFKYFGASIRKIRIYDRDNDELERAAIYKQLNEYCSESLNYLHLGTVKEIALKQLQKPFSKVIDLTMLLKTGQNGSIESMNEIFPKLQRLSIYYHPSTGESQFNGRLIESEVPHMEHLEEFVVSVCLRNHSDVAVIQKQIQQLFVKNPQIRSLIYGSQLNETIHVISENLPNLERLSVSSIGLKIEPVQFDHVKHLIVESDDPLPVDKLSFPRLEALKIYYTRKFENGSARDSVTSFFKNHQNIKQLNSTVHQTEGFVEFVSELPNVEEIYIESYENFQIDLVTGLFENHKNLMKFQYKSLSANQFNEADEAEMATYNEQFGNEWYISHSRYGRPTLTFEKKN